LRRILLATVVAGGFALALPVPASAATDVGQYPSHSGCNGGYDIPPFEDGAYSKAIQPMAARSSGTSSCS
jgi:hypothetical protein